MIQLFLNLRLFLNSWRKSGWIFLIILTCLLIFLNLIRWLFWGLMGLLLGLKWTIRDQGGLKVQEITRNSCRSYMDSLVKPNLFKISKIIQFLLELALCKSLVTIWNSLSRKKSKKMIIGKVYQSFSQAQVLQAKESTRSCSSSEPTKITFYLKIHIVYMVLMLI